MKKILVVDDEPEIVELLSMRLGAQGYEVITALGGAEAISLTRSQHPDLIILDVMMPAPDGYEVAGTLKNDPAVSAIPIIMLTAKTSEKDKEVGAKVGVSNYITKPYDPIQLINTIKDLIGE